MPKISELPNNENLAGYETIPIVQDGQTRQVMISDLLIAPRIARVDNARWVKSSHSDRILNSPFMNISLTSSEPIYGGR
ncbi:hypothetical protein CCP4SC76_6480007 [Gammaproteobacteria bacterium]